jgi:formate C-acetyltransferase
MASATKWQSGEPTVQQRIEALRKTKGEYTAIKVELYGYFDTDDHGYIPWTAPIPFEAVPNHPSGGCWGIKAIGESFRRWLEVHPVYIHPMSSLAGAWVRRGIPGVGNQPVPRGQGDKEQKQPVAAGIPGNWKPEDRVHHLTDRLIKYNVYNSGIGSANHLSPDMSIGLELGWGGLLEKVRHYRK